MPQLSVRLRLFLLLLVIAPFVRAQPGPATRQWIVDGVSREALVYAPTSAATRASPLIFAFHGHSGTMRAFDREMAFEKLWPEAIVVYPQGVPSPGRIVDHEGKLPGWQNAPGEQGDRDLKFFDAMLDSIEKDYKVDTHRIYSTGHSNGATFTYVLWRVRADKFAAFAPIASALSMVLGKPATTQISFPAVTPKPILHIAGEKDPLVKFQWQERTIDYLRKVNQCSEGKPWDFNDHCTIYPSAVGAPVISYVHAGGHGVPADAPEAIIHFFKKYTGPATQP
jgi:polyhydroxybutyrate depolymerase